MPLTEDELLAKQRKGATITAVIVAAIAFSIFAFTIYMNQ